MPFAPQLKGLHGGSRAIGQLLAELATRHDVAVIYLRSANEPEIDSALRERCQVVEEIKLPSIDTSLPVWLLRRIRLVLGFFQGKPMWVSDWKSTEYMQRVRAIVQRWRPDVAHIEYHAMAQYLPALRNSSAVRILTEHDPGITRARELYETRHGLDRIIHYLDMLSWERFERKVISEVQSVIVFTEHDRLALKPLAEGTPFHTIPLGTMLPEQSLKPIGMKPQNIIFVGNFQHLPNVDAATRLVREIYPQVQALYPGLQLSIVGKDPTPELQSMANDKVIVTGEVPDVTPYLDHATLVVVPLRLGGGMRVKVLEALAAGKAVIASPLAAEGLEVVDGQHIVLAQTNLDFCNAISRLLADSQQCEQLAKQARTWAVSHLRWDKSVAAYEQIYDKLLQ